VRNVKTNMMIILKLREIKYISFERSKGNILVERDVDVVYDINYVKRQSQMLLCACLI
jgi:hypothetical protein